MHIAQENGVNTLIILCNFCVDKYTTKVYHGRILKQADGPEFNACVQSNSCFKRVSPRVTRKPSAPVFYRSNTLNKSHRVRT